MRKILFLFFSYFFLSLLFADDLNNIIEKTIRFDKWEEAKIELENYLKSNPTDSNAYSLYGVVLKELKLYDEAIIATRSAINFEKEDIKKGEYYYNLGNIYYVKGLKDLAIQSYEKALNLNPNLFQAYYMLGLIYYENKEYEKCIEQWKFYVTLSTNIDKKNKILRVIAKFEKEIEEEKRRAEERKRKEEEERRKREEYLKNLKQELEESQKDSKSLEEYKLKEEKKEPDIEEID
ncbi:MAG TPA: tetratricopeptide repeat protein [Spirochaetota bacterium]|nr:tetratricopeptide repeat protein [Spirochaetota bacterium]HOL57340.1 tetratricopeptide repeat protein [Spirochaetota bacterium]HPP04909.1 tetratricopeptide repeat protein [Spirochaetota bacterium]